MKALIAVTAVLAALIVPSPAWAGDDPDETRLRQFVAALRADQGLAPLERHAELDAKARAWAATMAQAERISHSQLSAGITAGWTLLGENVAEAAYIEHAHQALVESPPHYANLTNPRYTHAGFGVARSVHGMLFVAEVFMALPPAPAPAAPAPSTPAPLEPASVGTPPAPAPAPVRTQPRRLPPPPPPVPASPPATPAPAATPSPVTTSPESIAALPGPISPQASASMPEPSTDRPAKQVPVLAASANHLAPSDATGAPGPADLPVGLALIAGGLAALGHLGARRRFARPAPCYSTPTT